MTRGGGKVEGSRGARRTDCLLWALSFEDNPLNYVDFNEVSTRKMEDIIFVAFSISKIVNMQKIRFEKWSLLLNFYISQEVSAAVSPVFYRAVSRLTRQIAVNNSSSNRKSLMNSTFKLKIISEKE